MAQARAGYEQAVAQSAAENPNVPITVTSNRATVDTDMQQVINAEAAIASAQRDYDSNGAKLRQAKAKQPESPVRPGALQEIGRPGRNLSIRL